MALLLKDLSSPNLFLHLALSHLFSFWHSHSVCSPIRGICSGLLVMSSEQRPGAFQLFCARLFQESFLLLTCTWLCLTWKEQGAIFIFISLTRSVLLSLRSCISLSHSCTCRLLQHYRLWIIRPVLHYTGSRQCLDCVSHLRFSTL